MAVLFQTLVILWTFLSPSLIYAAETQTNEPSCLSRFDYDYKMLKKLLEFEEQQATMKKTIDDQQKLIEDLQTVNKNYGSTYTRWGKKTCPDNGSSLVYTGYMAGGHHQHSGGGSNLICLTAQPLWDHYEDSISSGGQIYGTEYEFWAHQSTGASHFFGQNLFNKNAPCSVCHTQRSSVIMIPGRNECFNGWTREFSGYLVSSHHGHPHSSEYVCLDHRADTLDGNEINDDENLLYFVEGVCGKSLPCPPYVNGRELTCVVCSI